MALKGVEIEPAPKIGGHYYRVSEWDKDRPELPAVPAVDKAVWRKHNLLPDVIETTEALDGEKALDIEAEGIPANGIGNWTVADFKGIQRDEEAYKPSPVHSDSWNQCAGVLTYDGLQAFKVAEYLTLMAPEDAKPCQVESLSRLRERMAEKPLGKLIAEEPIYLGDWRQLVSGKELTPAQWAECVTADTADVQLQVKAVYAAARLEEPAQERMAKVPGWTPTNCYVGTVKDSQTSATAGYSWQTNADKYAMVFTTGSAYTIAALVLRASRQGALTGEMNFRIYAGDPSGAQTTMASGSVNLAEWGSSVGWIWCGLNAPVALANATVYTIEITTTAALNGTDYFYVSNLATGGGAGNQAWQYTAGAWSALGTARLLFATADNSDGGKYIIRADGNSADIFGASGPKGAAVHTSDTYTVTMGATLTRNGNHTILQGRQGDTVTGSTPAYAAQVATYCYGYEVVNAGVTVTWTGNATAASSGWIQNPIKADTSSKDCRLTFNGTSASHITVTNSVDSDAGASNRWTIQPAYGGINGTGYVDCKFTISLFTTGFAMVDATTTQTEHRLTNWTYTCTGNLANMAGANVYQAGANIPITLDNWILSCGTGTNYWISNTWWVETAVDPFAIRWPNLKLMKNGAGSITAILFGQINNVTAARYAYCDGFSMADNRFSFTTPADLTLTDTGTGGTLKATISNIASYADNDRLCFYDSGGNVLACISKAAYVAALYSKDANCALLTGLVDGTTYSGIYCKATRDGILYSAASGTASGTPTDGGKITPEEEALRNTDPGEAYVQRQADGGPASYKHLGVTKTPALNTAALEAAAYALGVIAGEANNDFDGGAGDIRTGKTLTLHGDDIPGELVAGTNAVDGAGVAAYDTSDNPTIQFDPGATVRVDGSIKLAQDAAGATVTLAVIDLETSTSTILLNAVPADFVGGAGKLLSEIKGSAIDFAPANGSYVWMLTVSHASLPDGASEFMGDLCWVGSTGGEVTICDAPTLAVAISGTTAAFELTEVDTDATKHVVYYRLAGQKAWDVGATVNKPTVTGTIAGLTKSKLYEFIAVPFADTVPGVTSNLERKWVRDTARMKALLDAIEAEVTALAWTGWTIVVGWDPNWLKSKGGPRLAVAPGDEGDTPQQTTNLSYSVPYPVRLLLIDRIQGPTHNMEPLLEKREVLRQRFMQRNVLSEVEGVFDVRVEGMPVVNDPDIDEKVLVTGVRLAVMIEETR